VAVQLELMKTAAAGTRQRGRDWGSGAASTSWGGGGAGRRGGGRGRHKEEDASGWSAWER
jgi:hypothetical protein